MPGRRKGARRGGPHHHDHAGWLHNYEDELPLKEGAKLLAKLVGALSERGEVRLDKTLIKPSDPAFFIIRYERAPAGEMKLKLEIEWEEDGAYTESTAGRPPEIE